MTLTATQQRNVYESIYMITSTTSLEKWNRLNPDHDPLDLMTEIIEASLQLEEQMEQRQLFWDGEWYDVCDFISDHLERGEPINWDKALVTVRNNHLESLDAR